MSDQNLVSNPFSALFSTIDEAQQFAEKSLPETSSVVDDATNSVTGKTMFLHLKSLSFHPHGSVTTMVNH